MFEINSVCFGVPLRLRFSRREWRQTVTERLPHAAVLVDGVPGDAQTFTLAEPEAAHGFRSLMGGQQTAEHPALEPVLEQFGRDLMIHVANLAPDRVFVHAGVLGWQGRAILLPGPSFAGKSTLTAALVRAGATYYSDEYAVLDERGWVHPYAASLQMRQPGGTVQRALPVEELAGTAGVEPLAVSAIYFLTYRAGAAWSPEAVSPGMAALELLRHTIPVQRTPARVMAALSAMCLGAAAWRGERGEADQTARTLLGLSR